MAASGIAAFLSTFLLLPTGSIAATLHDDKVSFVRREPATSSVLLKANGELVREKKHAGDSNGDCPGCELKDYIKGLEKKNGCRAWSAEGPVATLLQAKTVTDAPTDPTATVAAAAAVTNPSQAKCGRDPAKRGEECLLNDERTCRYAAKRANAYVHPLDFTLKVGLGYPTTVPGKDGGAATKRYITYQEVHPKGCFQKKCKKWSSATHTDAVNITEHKAAGTEDTQAVADQAAASTHGDGTDAAADGTEVDCFFFNLGSDISDDAEADFTGTPICQRHMYEDGEKDKASKVMEGADKSCPGEYKVIENENLCREMCEIEDYKCQNDIFRIGNGNYTAKHDYPQGCFHYKKADDDSTEVFFNSLADDKVQATAAVTGTPICRVADRFKTTNTEEFYPNQNRGAGMQGGHVAVCEKSEEGKCSKYNCGKAGDEVVNLANCDTACTGDACQTTCCQAKVTDACAGSGPNTCGADSACEAPQTRDDTKCATPCTGDECKTVCCKD